MPARFIQIHALTSYPGVLLNRDDAGFAKSLPFGGAVRTRISSQCLKRHWRTFEGKHSFNDLNLPKTVRSRETLRRLVYDDLKRQGVDEALLIAAIHKVQELLLGKSAKAKKTKTTADAETTTRPGEELHTGQIAVFGEPEVAFIKTVVATACAQATTPKEAQNAIKEAMGKGIGKKNIQSLLKSAGLGAALFGRMVTSDMLARGDAAIHVAHAMTVHEQQNESDYFSAVDDLSASEGELGSGHIGNVDLTSGLYYLYVVVDVPLLVSNLQGGSSGDWLTQDRALAAKVVEHLVHLVATVSPGAKLGSTAPYAYASTVMVETGDAQPRTLAGAFQTPVRVSASDVRSGQGMHDKALDALVAHTAQLDDVYGPPDRRLTGIGKTGEVVHQLHGERCATLSEVAAWAGGCLA